MIARFKSTSVGKSWWAVGLVVLLASLALTDARAPFAGGAVNVVAASAPDASGPPVIVATSPAVGATDVDPAVTEITVTFDRDMGDGFSWRAQVVSRWNQSSTPSAPAPTKPPMATTQFGYAGHATRRGSRWSGVGVVFRKLAFRRWMR